VSRWTPKLAISKTERRLKSIKARLEADAMFLARLWGDEDQYIVNLADRLRDGLDDIISEMREGLEYIAEKPEGDRLP
jgi:hypothetical protein